MTKPNTIAAAALLFLLATASAGAQELMDRDIPRPDPRTLLQQPPMPSLQKDANQDPPKPGIVQRVFDKKFFFLTALSIGTSIAATATITRCRRDHGIGPCTDGGYGPYAQREALRQVQTGFLILPSYKIKRIEDQDGIRRKFWWVFPAFNAAWNSGVMIENARKHYGPKDKD